MFEFNLKLFTDIVILSIYLDLNVILVIQKLKEDILLLQQK